jgi:hypothetical protein
MSFGLVFRSQLEGVGGGEYSVGGFSKVVYMYTDRNDSSSCCNIDPTTIGNRADALWWSDIVDSACNILFTANLRHNLTS